MRWFVLAVCTLVASTAHAQIELKNDGFAAGGQVAYQSGFVVNEAGASRFLAPAAGRQLLKVRFLFGSTTDTKTILLKVWDDSAGGLTPGNELYSGQYQVTGSNNGIVESDLTGENVMLPQQFRVGVVMEHNGLPSIARDNDGNIAADKNYIYANDGNWYKSQTFGLTGDWVIRAEISATSGPPGDAGVTDDGGVDALPAGDPCQGNPNCPLGQYCDLDRLVCTYECRTADDCGGGACNSLGQCIAAKDGGGCGCRTSDPSNAWIFGFVFLVWRRRR